MHATHRSYSVGRGNGVEEGELGMSNRVEGELGIGNRVEGGELGIGDGYRGRRFRDK